MLEAGTAFFGRQYRMQEKLRTIQVNREQKYLIFPTTKKWCFIKEDVHVGNNPYITVTDRGSRWKCFDEECKKVEVKLTPLAELPKTIRDLYAEIFHGLVSKDLMTEAKVECRRNITDDFPDETPEDVDQVHNTLMTLAKRQQCKKCGSSKTHFEHQEKGYCIRCLDCQTQWPKGLITFPQESYPKLLTALTQLNIAIGTVNNYTTINNYGEGSLEFFTDFTSDNLQVFEDLLENQLFVEALLGTDMAMSQFTSYHFRERFHCTSDEDWYEYRGHCWSDNAAALAYKEALGEKTFLRPFHQVTLQFENAAIQTDELKRKSRALRKLCISLEDGKFRDRIVTDSIMKLHRQKPDFAKDLNSQNIMVFQNGVYNFDDGSFGPGSPSVPVTMCVPQDFHPYDPDNEHVRFLMQFMEDILPNQEVREYTLKVLGICLTHEVLQYFFIWTGSGGNGKGRLVRLMEECLGPYYQTVSPTMLTKKREDANQANEALMSLVKSRLAVFQEAEASDVLQGGILKSITGADTMSSRQNYGRQVKFRPVFKSLFVCNDLPNMSENTWGLWRRIRCVDFPVRFVEKPVLANERAIDYNLDEKLKAASPWFIGVLIEHFQRYKKEGLGDPALVRQVTEKYRDTQDVVKEFMAEKMVRHDDQDVLLWWTDLRAAYMKVHKKPPPFNKVTEPAWQAFVSQGLHYVDSTLAILDRKKFRGFRGWSLRPDL